MLFYYLVSMPEGLEEEDGDETKVIREWKEFRVEFTIVSWVASILETKPFLLIQELEEEVDYFDENGIFRMSDVSMGEEEVGRESDSAESDDE